jgi:hypothetical protein
MATKTRGGRAERRTVQVARAAFKKAKGNQTADTPGTKDDRWTARKRTVSAARKAFKTMAGNQTPKRRALRGALLGLTPRAVE